MKKTLYKWLIFISITIFLWLFYMIKTESLHLLSENFQILITMVFGSFIAGASSEGGGAIAFPVFTLLLELTPEVSRNFSLAIQSIGMTSASIMILEKKIAIQKEIILPVSISGCLGFILGTLFLIPLINPLSTKLLFVSIWLSFSFVLLSNQPSKEIITHFKGINLRIIIIVGFLGGVITSFFGNGIDILTFSILTIYFGLNEKSATHTSIILMAILSIFGFLFHSFIIRDFNQQSTEFWLTAIPVVVIIAPFGAYVINKFSSNIIRMFLVIILNVQFIGALLILKMNSNDYILVITTVVAGFASFWLLKKRRKKAFKF